MVTEYCDGRQAVSYLDRGCAWAAAQAVARVTHFGVTLYGKYGTAHFGRDGGGTVSWNELSDAPGTVNRFGPDTTVCIN